MIDQEDSEIEDQVNAKLREISHIKELNKKLKALYKEKPHEKQLRVKVVDEYLRSLDREEYERIFSSRSQPFVFLMLKMLFVKRKDQMCLFSLKPASDSGSNHETHQMIFREQQIIKPLLEFFKPIPSTNKNTLKVFNIQEESLAIEEEFLGEVVIKSIGGIFDTLTFSTKLLDDPSRLLDLFKRISQQELFKYDGKPKEKYKEAFPLWFNTFCFNTISRWIVAHFE